MPRAERLTVGHISLSTLAPRVDVIGLERHPCSTATEDQAVVLAAEARPTNDALVVGSGEPSTTIDVAGERAELAEPDQSSTCDVSKEHPHGRMPEVAHMKDSSEASFPALAPRPPDELEGHMARRIPVGPAARPCSG